MLPGERESGGYQNAPKLCESSLLFKWTSGIRVSITVLSHNLLQLYYMLMCDTEEPETAALLMLFSVSSWAIAAEIGIGGATTCGAPKWEVFCLFSITGR